MTGRERTAASVVESLQTTLAAEHAAVFVLAYLGAQTSRTATPTLFGALDDAYTAHRGRRDQLSGVIRALDAEPVAAAVAYDLPDADSTDTVKRSALQVERRSAATYVFLVASSTGTERARAVGFLLDSAVRELGFGGAPEDLPGT